MDNQKIPTTLGTIIIIIFAITMGVFVWKYETIKDQEDVQMQGCVTSWIIKNNTTPRVSYNENNPVLSETSSDAVGSIWTVVNESDSIKKGSIDWQDPIDIGDLGLTNKKLYAGCVSGECGDDNEVGSNGIKYLKVGTIISGSYKNSDLILIVSEVYEGPSMNPVISRIIKKGDSITLLSYGFDEYLISFIKSYFSEGSGSRVLDGGTIIDELNFPENMEGDNGRQKLEKDSYVRGFFTNAKLKPVFIHSQYGQVWMTNSDKSKSDDPTKFELNSYKSVYNKKGYHDVFGRQGFYIKAPDGTVVAYKLVLDIFDKMDRIGILKADWKNGEKNEIDYEENPSGCGAGDYIYNKTSEINLDKDVIVVGRTMKGDNLYGYKNIANKELRRLYDETFQVYGDTKNTIEEYLKMNPVVFWVDPFGRTLAFYRSDFLSPAECGKPVIYLYPEKPMNVSVQVKPGNGLSYTEPEYGQGWNVFADTQSNLQNLADGKTYPYLFWEGSGSVFYEQPKQGFVVAKDDLDGFFNDKLAQLGLIGKEITDFKEYWIPKMSNSGKPYYFVTFLSKHYIDALAPLTINPKPETVIRVLMDYRGLDNPETVQSIPLVAPERKGFTAVEWGGFLK